jgi:putative transposase
MPGKRHSEEQILYALRQIEGGKKVREVCREMGVSQQAVYSWKRRYAGLGLHELRELRQLPTLSQDNSFGFFCFETGARI